MSDLNLKRKNMAQITLKGNPVNTVGELPNVGEKAKDFTLVKGDLSRVSLNDFKGQKLVLNIFPSLDTGTCAASVRYFNQAAAELKNTKVLCISRDLPFAQARFCGAEGIENVVTLSDYATGEFGKNYGLEIADGPLAGLHSRVVIILDENGTVSYTQQVPEIVDEPNYDEALASLK
jgi:thiol peroxidase